MVKAEYIGPDAEGLFKPGQVYDLTPVEGNEVKIGINGRRFVVVEYPNIYEFFKDWKVLWQK